MIDQENIRKAIRQYRDRWRTFRYWTVVEIAVMTAAGIGCVGLSANEDWHFYYEGTAEPVSYTHLDVYKRQIPDDEAIVISTNQGEPLAGTNTPSGQAYLDISRRIMGEEIPMYAPRQNRTFFARLSGLLKRA